MSGCGNCGPSWDCSDAGWTPKPAGPVKFEVTNKLGPCVPSSALKSLPEFLKWFSENGIPVICQLSALKDSTCSVLSGKDGKLAAIPFSVMFNDCLPCVDFLKKLDGATSCIPRLPAEQASLVSSVDPVSGVVAWRSPPVVDCDVLTNLLKPGPGACYPETTNVPKLVLGQTDVGDLGWMPPPAIDCAALLPLLDGPASCIPRSLTEQASVVASIDPVTGVIAWRLPPAIDCDVLSNLLKPGPGACYPESTNSPAKVFALTDTGELEWMPIDCKVVKTALESSACLSVGTIAKNVGFDATGKLVQMTPATAAETPLTVVDTPTVNLTAGTAASGGHTGIKADVILATKATNIIKTTPTGLLAEITCADVKLALEGACIPEELDAPTIFAFNTAGKLVKVKRRKLIHMAYRSANIPDEIFAGLSTPDLATRRAWKWEDYESSGLTPPAVNPNLAPGQSKGDLTYVLNADGSIDGITVGHGAVYTLSTSVFAKMKATTPWNNLQGQVSILTHWLIIYAGSATERRLGESTMGTDNPSLRNPSSDWMHSGTITLYLPAGTTIKVRTSIGAGSIPASVIPMELRMDYPNPASTLSITEHPMWDYNPAT